VYIQKGLEEMLVARDWREQSLPACEVREYLVEASHIGQENTNQHNQWQEIHAPFQLAVPEMIKIIV
jgi:hypothetical protein